MWVIAGKCLMQTSLAFCVQSSNADKKLKPAIKSKIAGSIKQFPLPLRLSDTREGHKISNREITRCG